METETGETKIALSSTVPVSVTDNGFDPDVVTVTVGTTVEWTNRTQETVHLQSGEPYRIYLPLVLRNVGGAGGQAASAPEPASQAEVRLAASATFSGTLPPGGTLTHTFTSEGNYPYFLTNNPAWTGLVNVEPIPFDFEMGVTPPSRSVAQGQSVTYTVRVTGTLGDPQPVTLTVGGLPAVAAWELNPSTVVPTGTAVLSITTALTTPVGNHTLIITGTGGGRVHTATATLAVMPHPDFEVAIAPAMRSVVQGQSVTYTVSLTGLHGFDKPVSLSVDGLPAGTAAIWDQNPLTPTDTTVLTITTSLTTPLGSHSLTVIGSGGGLTQTAEMTLTVVAALTDLVVESIQTTPAIPIAGQDTLITVTIRNQGETVMDSCQADWYVNPASPPGVGDCGVVSWTVNGLGPGTSVALTTTRVFTPSGDYGLWGQADTLDTVAEGNEVNNVTGPVTATVLSAVQEVCGTISEDTTWYSGVVYVVTCDVTVNNGVALIIQPEVIVKFRENARLIVKGVLNARGTSGNQIAFTSYKDDTHGGDTNGDGSASAPAPNDWGWIEFGDSSVDNQNFLEYCTILYGGKDYWSSYDRYYGAVYLISASPTISHCTFSYNGNYAIEIDTGSFPTVTGNTFTDNGTNGIGVYWGTISTDGIWTSTDYPYVLDANVAVAEGASLTISPGVVVKGKPNTRLIIKGVLDARGASDNQIVFTSYKDDAHGGDTNGDGGASAPAPDDWGWIEFTDSSVDNNNSLEYCTILYGGKDYWDYYDRYYGAVRLISASPTISHCTFSHNGNYAIGIDTGSFPTVTGNTFTDNGTNGIGVYGGAISTDGTWNSTDYPYILNGDITVAEGTSLTIFPGVVVKGRTNTRLIVNGILDARGTLGNRIVFTSYKDDAYGGDTNNDGSASAPAPDDWGWIEFTDSSVDNNNSLEYCTILYGGKDYWDYYDRYYGAVRLISASPTISHCTLSHNGNYAIGIDTGSFPTVTGNTFTDNGTNGIGVYGGAISTDGTWNSTDYPYILNGDITVAEGTSLTIFPGVVVKGRTNTRLIVNGILDARGTLGNRIVFTSYKDDAYGGDTNNDGSASAPAPDDWGWIEFTDSSVDDQNLLEYCDILYGGKDYWDYYDRYYGAVYLVSASPTISHCTFSYNGNYAIGIDTGSFPTVTGNTFTDNGTNGIGVYGGTISTDGTWNSTDYPYVLNSDITVAEGGSLTISPGVVVKGRTNTRLIVNGTLDARGTLGNRIVFTSYKDDAYGGDTNNDGSASAPAPDDWGWIEFTDSSVDDQNLLEYCDILYGGKDYWDYYDRYYGAVYLVSASPTISHCTFSYNGNYAIGIDTGSFPTVTGNTFTDNGTNGIGVYGGTISTDGTWNSTDYPYVLNSDITVAEGGSLTISPGVVVKGRTNTRLIVNGTLDARGASGNRITFTSYKDDTHGGDTNGDGSASAPAPNDWGWIEFGDSSVDAQNFLEYCTILYGGKDYWSSYDRYYGAVYLVSASPTISHCTFSYNGNYAIGIDTGSFPTVTGNTFTDNGTNGIGVYGGTISTDGTWNSTDYPYVLNSDITVAEGGSLTISPGVVVKGRTNTRLIVNGTLDARGASGNRITFTSYKDDAHGGDTNNDGSASAPAPNDWGWIEFGDSSVDAQNFLEYCTILYGGKEDISGWDYYGAVRLISASPTIRYNTIAHNSKGLWTESGSSPLLRNNSFYFNSEYAVYNADSSTIVDAENNWWGHESGPYHPTLNPSGQGDRVSDGVDFDPWVGQSTYTANRSAPSSPATGFETDPVNIVFGNYVHQRIDLSVPDRGAAFVFERAYNSVHATVTSPLSYGWRHSYDITVVVTETAGAASFAIVTWPDGRQDRYTKNDGFYTPPAGIYHTLVQNSDGTFTLTRKDQIQYNFTAQGSLASIVDSNGNTMIFGYAGDNLSTITLSNGCTVTLTYSGSRLTGLADPAGRTVGFGYTGGHLTVVTDTRGFTTTYAYDAQGRLESIADANNYTFVHNTYNADGRVVEQRDALSNLTTFTYYTATRQTVVVDPLGHVITHTYDSAYRITGEQDALGHQATYEWDSDNNRTAVTDKRDNTTYYAYDGQGNVTQIVDTLDYTRTFTYDAFNNPTGETNPLGHTTVYTYDASSNLIARADPQGNVTTWAYDTYGQVISQTNALPRTTRYAYDAYGHQTAITDALTNTTTFTYDLVGRKLSETDPESHTTNYAYDAINHITVITDALSNPTFYTYDAVGNRTIITDANGHPTTYTYDEKDRLSSMTNSTSGTVTYTYDANNNLTSTTDANNHTTTYAYDDLDRLVSTTDPLSHTIAYTYDAVGNLVNKSLPNGIVLTYTYDALDHLIAIQYLTTTIQHAYDAAGNRTVMTDTTGTTYFSYDVLNHLVRVQYPTSAITYTYDAVGNRTGIIYPGGQVVTHTYDAVDRMVNVADWAGNVVTYTYDAAGQLLSTIYSNGVTSSHIYNDAGWSTVITHTSSVSGTFAHFRYTYDNVGNPLSEIGPSGTTTYAYDTLSRLVQVDYPDGETVIYSYDPMGNRTGVTSTVSGAVAYTYDADDHLLTAGSDTFGWDANGRLITRTHGDSTATYTFDPLDRLIQVISGTTTVAFTYTGDGMRVNKNVNGIVTSYAQDRSTGLATVLVETTGGQDTLYTYGLALLAQVQPDSSHRYYHIDALGSVRALTNDAGQSVATYSYDAFGVVRSQTAEAGNPFGFASEQNDPETGLIFLRARYYDPALGRFISRDPQPSVSVTPRGLNRYIYALDNPVALADPDGEIPVPLITGGIGGIVGGTGYALETGVAGDTWNWGKFGTAVGAGMLTGAAAPGIAAGGLGTSVAAGVTALVGVSAGGVKYTINTTLIDGRDPTWSGLAFAWAEGAGKSFMGKPAKLGYSLVKGAIRSLIRPRLVYAPGYDFGYWQSGFTSGGGGAWGGPPSGGK